MSDIKRRMQEAIEQFGYHDRAYQYDRDNDVIIVWENTEDYESRSGSRFWRVLRQLRRAPNRLTA
jgi:hypothetical protein